MSILGDNNPEWFWCELGVQAARAVVAGLNPGGSNEETKGLMTLARAKFALAQDQEQVDKLLQIKKELPSIQKIVYWQGKGLRHYSDPTVISLAEVMRLGEGCERSQPGDFERKLAHAKGNDIAMMLFTLGANGALKVVPATHSFLISSAEAALASNPVYSSDEYASIISPAWYFEQTLGFGVSLLRGQKLNFAEKADTVPEDSREISPHALAYPPKLWEKIAEAIQENTASSTWLKRALFNRGLSMGYERADLLSKGGQMDPLKKFNWRIADLTVFHPLRDKHGLNRARVIYVAGALLSKETQRFFRAVGVDVKQIFGSTKGGIVLAPPPDDLRIE